MIEPTKNGPGLSNGKARLFLWPYLDTSLHEWQANRLGGVQLWGVEAQRPTLYTEFSFWQVPTFYHPPLSPESSKTGVAS
ncbi:MAG: hypothetical protein CK530_01530 [Planctomycetaceae bacterium]|nr:MAG: hypothetical protein CK530_01530 [Planctomycetaceae bacterium]